MAEQLNDGTWAVLRLTWAIVDLYGETAGETRLAGNDLLAYVASAGADGARRICDLRLVVGASAAL